MLMYNHGGPIITKGMIAATERLYKESLPGWLLADQALKDLRDTYRDRSDEVSCLIKASVVSKLYGTRVDYLPQVARHISVELNAKSNEGLVERIARGGRDKQLRSFAAKYCHFFVDPDEYPIYDSAACEALGYFLGKACDPQQKESYGAFCQNLQRLRASSSIEPSARELDRCLWIIGLWLSAWATINREVRDVFVRDPAGLQEILPRPLYQSRADKLRKMEADLAAKEAEKRQRRTKRPSTSTGS